MPKNIAQTKLFPREFAGWTKDKFAFGGSLLRGSHPKIKRHFQRKLPLHVVLYSSRASGNRSLFLRNRAISRILDKQASKHFVRIYNVANAGNHIHILLQAPAREYLSRFLRAIAGRIAELMSVEKGFWDARPFSRIVSWGRDFSNVARYIGINSTEMLGLLREDVRGMFLEIEALLRRGMLTKTPTLVATGFG